MNHTRGKTPPLAVKLSTSGTTHSHGVTGGVYKARERIHRGVLIRRLLAIRLHVGELQPTSELRLALRD